MKQQIAVFWFRRDLRLTDNTALFHALKSGQPVLPVFIFDTQILKQLNSKEDARVSYIYSRVSRLKNEIEKHGSSLKVIHANPLDAFQQLNKEYKITSVFSNRDFEPYAILRDMEVESFLQVEGVKFHAFTDHVIFEPGKIVKPDNKPYTVFTPYSNRWKAQFAEMEINTFDSEKYIDYFLKINPFLLPDLADIGFVESELKVSDFDLSETLLTQYEQTRNLPSIKGTSKIGVHLRFGTVSIREVTQRALQYSEVFLNELIWRNFFIDILWHFPQVENKAFKPKYDYIEWRNNVLEFEKWCKGVTGYPLVDAGMRELNETGFMHNRVRMVTASFLTKHLLIDWRWGEAYFAEKLLDFELASNNGNWQWAAGCGCDAAPYFRVFNPETQQIKFDSKKVYILKWVPEYGTLKYPNPIVDHRKARERVLQVYKKALE